MAKWLGAVLVAFSTAIPADLHACECALATADEKYELATVVVSARLMSAKIVEGWNVLGTFEVRETFKGQSPETLTLRSNADGEEVCGVSYVVGGLYLLYLTDDDESISYCDGSGLVSFRKQEYDDLVGSKNEK